LLEGNPSTALRKAFSLVLTESSAKKLFGSESALNQTVLLSNGREYTVTGVVKDPPKFSHLRFDMLGSLSSREITEQNRYDKEMAWDNIWQGYSYILLPETIDLNNLQANLDKLSEKRLE
jgi:putative ABC transport system permease protein